MSLLIIAALYKDRRGGSIGYRILDTESCKTIDTYTYSIVSVIKSGKAVIDNVKLENDKLIGINGSLDRYTKCTMDNRLLDPNLNTVIIINRLGTKGFTISDFKGVIKKVKDEDLIKYAKSSGIANGKLVTVDGNTFISAINGNYPVIDIPDEPENKNVNLSPPKQEKSNVEDSILTKEQKLEIGKYYTYLNNAGKLIYNTEKIKEISKNEAAEIVEIVKSNDLKSNYSKYQKYLYIISLINNKDRINEIIHGDSLIEHMEEFITVKLPFPESMMRLFNNCLIHDKLRFIKYMYSDIPDIDYVYSRALKIEALGAKDVINFDKRFPGDITDIKSLDSYVACIYKLSELSRKIAEVATFYKINVDTIYKTLKDGNHLGIDDKAYYVIRMAINYYNLHTNTNYEMFNSNDNNTYKVLEIMDSDYLIDIIKKSLTTIKDGTTIPVTNKEFRTLSNVFNNAYSDKQNSSDNIIEETPLNSVAITKLNNSTTGNTEYSTKPKNMNILEWLKYLLDRNSVNDNDISIKIAKDILNRKVKLDALSSKQVYRINLATKLAEKANNDRLGLNKSNTTNSGHSVPDEENQSFDLDTHPEIKNDVEELITKADSVEMQEVLKEHPKLINICYSILKYNKASTRQLNHVNAAITLLRNQ